MRSIPKKPPSDYLYQIASSRFPDSPNKDYPLHGQIAIVTGSSGGLGKEIASELYGLGATVILAARNVKKCEAAKIEIESSVREKTKDKEGSGKLHVMELDTSDLDAVKNFAESFEKKYNQLDWLGINNIIIYFKSFKKKLLNQLNKMPSNIVFLLFCIFFLLNS